MSQVCWTPATSICPSPTHCSFHCQILLNKLTFARLISRYFPGPCVSGYYHTQMALYYSIFNHLVRSKYSTEAHDANSICSLACWNYLWPTNMEIGGVQISSTCNKRARSSCFLFGWTTWVCNADHIAKLDCSPHVAIMKYQDDPRSTASKIFCLHDGGYCFPVWNNFLLKCDRFDSSLHPSSRAIGAPCRPSRASIAAFVPLATHNHHRRPYSQIVASS